MRNVNNNTILTLDNTPCKQEQRKLKNGIKQKALTVTKHSKLFELKYFHWKEYKTWGTQHWIKRQVGNI